MSSGTVATVNNMLQSSAGRDLLMGVAQFVPVVLLPVVERTGNLELAASLSKLAALAGEYRSVTRFSGLFSMVTKGKIPEVGTSIESFSAFMEWFCTLMFFPMENIATLTGKAVLNRGAVASRKGEYGPRCVYFWFWSLVFAQISHITALARLSTDSSEEGQKKMRNKVKSWISSLCWFIMAWGCMPAKGTTVKLLSNPQSSILRPLHMLVEKTTVSQLPVSEFTKGMCGVVATFIAIMDYKA